MNRDLKGLLILIFAFPIPIIRTSKVAGWVSKFYPNSGENDVEKFTEDLRKFRKRQACSFLLIIILFLIAFLVIGIPMKLHCLQLISVFLLAQAVFGQMGWEIQSWSGDTLIELLNKWWFRVIYSIGVFLLILSILR